MMDVPCGLGGCAAKFFGDLADLGEGAGEEARDLGLERAGVDDLSERGVGGDIRLGYLQ